MSRPLFMVLGALCVAIGALGVVLLLVPTTPFVLLGAVFFARSSPTLYGWLIRHRVFGPLITDWKTHRAIAPRTKAVALATMGAALGISVALGVPPIILIVQAAVLAAAAIFIFTRPSAPRAGTLSLAGDAPDRNAVLSLDAVAEQRGTGQQHQGDRGGHCNEDENGHLVDHQPFAGNG